MQWKRAVNVALSRATGHELRRVRGPQDPGRAPGRSRLGADRLVPAPTIILCTLRSGSTLLRMLMDSHSQIHSPHELHLRYVGVTVRKKWGKIAMREMGLDERRLEYLLWDRILHRELAKSGKKHIVTKTPNDVFIADRIRECWPDAKFIFLLRHPAAIARSRQNLRPGADAEDNVETILKYGEALEKARRKHDGLTVRYEEVTADPAAATQRICSYIGLPWEPAMLEYGKFNHGRFRPGLGDWADKIKTGEVRKAEPPPPADAIPPALRPLAVSWGYITAEQAALLPAADPAG